jgi:hypothetical protein
MIDTAKYYRPFLITLSIGSLGGAALIITIQLTNNGPAIFIPYAVLVIAIIATLRAVNWSSYSKRFITSFLTFLVATIILDLYIGIFDAGTIGKIPLWGHIWRFGIMAAIGGTLSGAVAYLANIGRR